MSEAAEVTAVLGTVVTVIYTLKKWGARIVGVLEDNAKTKRKQVELDEAHRSDVKRKDELIERLRKERDESREQLRDFSVELGRARRDCDAIKEQNDELKASLSKSSEHNALLAQENARLRMDPSGGKLRSIHSHKELPHGREETGSHRVKKDGDK